MRTLLLVLSVGALGGGAAAGATWSMDVTSTISGTAGTEYVVWEQTSATTLAQNNSLNTLAGLTGTVNGNMGAVGGNVELFANSETGGITIPMFAVQTPVTLSGTVGGHSLTLRSLNGSDWFADPLAPTYGVNDRANAWFDAFLGKYGFDSFLSTYMGLNAGQIQVQRQTLFTMFVTGQDGAGGFQRMSDPNIGYAYFDSGDSKIHVGLEGSDSVLDIIVSAYVAAVAPQYVQFLQTGITASETVMVSVDGGPERALWGFTGTPTGLATTDGTTSYTTNFEVTADVTALPEPATLGVLAMGAAGLLLRRRRR